MAWKADYQLLVVGMNAVIGMIPVRPSVQIGGLSDKFDLDGIIHIDRTIPTVWLDSIVPHANLLGGK